MKEGCVFICRVVGVRVITVVMGTEGVGLGATTEVWVEE